MMRKILLGTTAVVGAALLAPATATAQEAPTVRIGGYLQAYYGYTNQSSKNATGVTLSQPAQVTASSNNGQASTLNVVNAAGATIGTVSVPGTSTAVPVAGVGSVRTGKHDLSTDAEIHVFVNGKAANGLSYGAVVEIAFDANEGTSTGAARRSFTHKTNAILDEAYIFLASPRFGQIRAGDEDGPMGGLMNTGVVTNFGTGGIYGYWQNFTIRPNRTTNGPGDFGDNTKVIYLSPQYFGFDAGISYAANSGIGQDTGCVGSSGPSYGCDRTYAYTGATANAIQSLDGTPQRRNEVQGVVRWRGDVAGIGIATHMGIVSWQSQRDITSSGTVYNTLRPGQVYQAGLQASAYGVTVGANYEWGQENFFHGSVVRGDKSAQQTTIGASYTVGAFTIGANTFFGSYAGNNGSTFCIGGGYVSGPCTGAASQTGQLLKNTNGTQNSMRRWAYSMGANYRLAPGLDLVAEYTRHVVHEPGVVGFGALGAGTAQDRLQTDVVILGTRLAF